MSSGIRKLTRSILKSQGRRFKSLQPWARKYCLYVTCSTLGVASRKELYAAQVMQEQAGAKQKGLEDATR